MFLTQVINNQYHRRKLLGLACNFYELYNYCVMFIFNLQSTETAWGVIWPDTADQQGRRALQMDPHHLPTDWWHPLSTGPLPAFVHHRIQVAEGREEVHGWIIPRAQRWRHSSWSELTLSVYWQVVDIFNPQSLLIQHTVKKCASFTIARPIME